MISSLHERNDTFMLVDSVSQWALLKDPSVALVVSGCGMTTVQESIVAGKPILAAPSTAENVCDRP